MIICHYPMATEKFLVGSKKKIWTIAKYFMSNQWIFLGSN
jgi:hypothetical protein